MKGENHMLAALVDWELHLEAIKGLFGIAVNIICGLVGLALMGLCGVIGLTLLMNIAPYLP